MPIGNIVLLGCGGYIGSHLLDRLLREPGNKVFGWDLEHRKIEQYLNNPALDFEESNIGSAYARQRLEEQVASADVVINLAAICNPAEYNTEPLRVLDANLFDLQPVLRMCAEQRKWLIHFSTSEVYGRTISSYLPDESFDDPDLYVLKEDETPLIMGPIRNQRWTYAAAKQVVERLVYAYHRERGMPFTVIRPLNFFGPRMDYLPGHDGDGVPRVLASFMAALIDRKPLQLVDGGWARRTIVSIDDAMDAVMAVLQQPERSQNQFFNVGNPDNEVTVRELAELMRAVYAEITDDPTYLEHPIHDVSAADFYGAGYEDCDRRMPSIEKAKALLGWTPRKSLRTTLLETMRAYHETYVVNAAAPPAEATGPAVGSEGAR
ncbi:NAD-dependent epimerase/dehydratase family protein [Micromonospora sp. NPDC048170]|uniref:NAD-dependent epimerase/dehydratase family protein n=1 Tax=Micromonospora sp. NPDC048170 TaxID=3154819 RepID=UPI0033EA9F94